MGLLAQEKRKLLKNVERLALFGEFSGKNNLIRRK